MPSLGIAPWPRRVRASFTSARRAGAGVRCPVPAEVNLPLLEIGIQAIKLSPYHAGLPAHRPGHLDPAAGLLACSCPRFTFRLRVSHQTQEPPFESLPAEPGIQPGATWRTE